MAEIQLATSSQKNVWRTSYYKEFLRKSGLMPYMGKGPNNIIRVSEDLINKGKNVHFPMIGALRGNGVRGAEVLVGKEDDQANYDDMVGVDFVRNGLVVPEYTTYQTEIDLWNAAKDGLKDWSARMLKNDMIDALGGIIIPGAAATVGNNPDTWVKYGDATAAQKNAYGANNSDRILFGSAVGNYSATWATALGNIDSTNDRLSAAVGRLAADVADTTGPENATNPTRTSITPYTTEDGVYSGYVMFCAPNSFRDLRGSTEIQDAWKYAAERGKNNPLFQAGDIIKDNIIYRKLPELQRLVISAAGNGGIDVDQNFLCGQAALIVGWGMRPEPRTKKEDDYGMRPGTAIVERRGQKKASYNGTLYGCVPVLTASVPNA
jgi:N4-gp56 family major capsid protein